MIVSQHAMGEVVKKPSDIMPSLDNGALDCAIIWPYLITKDPHVLQMAGPPSGAATGFNLELHDSWFLYGGGKTLYNRYWKDKAGYQFTVIPFMKSREALGWTKKPIQNFSNLDGMTFRTPGGVNAKIYQSMGVDAKPMGLGKTLESMKNNELDGAEWCCPWPDEKLGFSKYFKHYYIQGAHQNITSVDLIISPNVWSKLSKQQRAAIEVAAEAMMYRSRAMAIRDHAQAIDRMTKDGITLHPTEQIYFDQFNAQALKAQQATKDQSDPLYQEIVDSQSAYGKLTAPYVSHTLSSDQKLMKASHPKIKS